MRRLLPALFAYTLTLAAQTNQPQASFVDASHTTLRLEVDGKPYLVDVAAGTVRPAIANGSAALPGAEQFAARCSGCHGTDGRGISSAGTPNFTNRDFQAKLSEQQIADTIRNGKSGRMPAFGKELSNEQISALATYVRSFGASSASSPGGSSGNAAGTEIASSGIYQAGDDQLFTLPTGRPVDEHAVIVNFTHRFAYDSAVTGQARGAELFGLDNFALSSFGLRYGVTDKLSVDVWRSPSFIGRPIQLMAAYNIFDEHHEEPFNLAFRVSVEGQNNFRKNYTENLEMIVSRSLTSRAQIYFVPTASFNDRRLVQGSLESNQILDEPGINAFSLGTGLAVDIRPTVALIAEVIPTVVGGTELGIHRPPFSFAIQKKLYRHAFTFGFTTSPGTTVSQRAGTNATFLNSPSADTPAGLFLGFDLTRRIY
jgi:mono/diheme cytochrome c family protein